MIEPEPIGERVARVETRIVHIAERLEEVGAKLDAMHDMFQQAKGARYFIVGAAAFMGFVGAKWSAIVAFLVGK